jgi:hypothetical protein
MTEPTKRLGRPPSGNALSPAERQRRYRERQKAKATDPGEVLRLRGLVDELRKECERLAGKVITLESGIKARDRDIERRSREVDAKTAENHRLAQMVSELRAAAAPRPEPAEPAVSYRRRR